MLFTQLHWPSLSSFSSSGLLTAVWRYKAPFPPPMETAKSLSLQQQQQQQLRTKKLQQQQHLQHPNNINTARLVCVCVQVPKMFSSALGRKGERILKFPVPDSLSLSSLSLSFSLSPFLLANGHKGTLSLGKKKEEHRGGLLYTH